MAENFTEQRQEFRGLTFAERAALLNHLRAVERGRRDTEFFASYFLGLETNHFQRRLYQAIDGKMNAGEMAELLVKAGNRSGKTLGLAVIHIKFAFYKTGISPGPGFDRAAYNTFDVSPVSRQAKQCAEYVRQILDGRLAWEKDGKRVSNQDGLRLKDFVESFNESAGILRYVNGSRSYFIGVGGDQAASIQGLSAGIITYDECVLSHHLRDELTGNLYSRLGDYGRVLMLVSTPNEEGPSQQFFFTLYRGAKKGTNGFLLVEGNFNENTFIDDKQRAQHIARVTGSDPTKAKQVLAGDFVTTGGRMFENEVIERLWNGKKEPTQPDDTKDYLISIDWGVADAGDETVMLVWDITQMPWVIVNAYCKQGGSPYELEAVARAMYEHYNRAIVVMDTASMGGVMFKKMLKDIRPVEFNAQVDGGKVKSQALSYMILSLTRGRKVVTLGDEVQETNPNWGLIRSYYLPKLEDQLAIYRADDEKLKQDWVSAFYIGNWYLYKRYFKNPEKKKSFELNLFRRKKQASLAQRFDA